MHVCTTLSTYSGDYFPRSQYYTGFKNKQTRTKQMNSSFSHRLQALKCLSIIDGHFKISFNSDVKIITPLQDSYLRSSCWSHVLSCWVMGTLSLEFLLSTLKTMHSLKTLRPNTFITGELRDAMCMKFPWFPRPRFWLFFFFTSLCFNEYQHVCIQYIVNYSFHLNLAALPVRKHTLLYSVQFTLSLLATLNCQFYCIKPKS